MRGLYAIVDVEALGRRTPAGGGQRGLDPVRFAEAVLSARPAALQLRDKAGGARHTLALLRDIAVLTRRAGVPFFANDRPDLAILAGCNGVHVGQEDVPAHLARSLGACRRPQDNPLLVGLSTHDAEQLEAALPEQLDYVAIGPVFPTASKDRPSPVLGLGGLAALAARWRAARPGVPVVAIGGITGETAAAVGALADAAAVIGALVPEAGARAYEEAEARARALQELVVSASLGAPLAAGPGRAAQTEGGR